MKKKFLLICAVLVGLSVSAGLLQKVFAVAPAYSKDGVCRSVDNTYFPFGFLCGGDNTDVSNMTFTGGSDDAASAGKTATIGPTSYKDFTVGFNNDSISRASAGSKTKAGVLVWAYVYLTDPTKPRSWFPGASSNTAITNTDGTVDTCPGDGNPNHPKLYNFNDGSTDQSPAGFNGDDNGYGVENCHNNGVMVYWWLPDGVDANQKPRFSFRLNLNPKNEGEFCVRESVSVAYPGDYQALFPGPDYDGANSYNNTKNWTAARVAKQGERHCYSVQNNKPTGSLSLKCSINDDGKYDYTVTGKDPDVGDGQLLDYEIIHKIPNQNNYVQDVTGQIASGGSVSGSYAFIARTYILKIKDFNTDNYEEPPGAEVAFTPCKKDTSLQCETYTQKPLQEHSIYRIATFGKDTWHVTSAPSGKVYDGTWAGLDGTQDYRSNALNTGDSTDPTPPFTDAFPSGYGIGYNFQTRELLLDFRQPSGPDRVVFIENWHHLQPGESFTINGVSYGPGDWYYSTLPYAKDNCYSASCDDVQFTFDDSDKVPGTTDGVYANKTVKVSMVMHNTGWGNLEASALGAPLQITDSNGSGGAGWKPNPTSIPAGGSAEVNFSVGSGTDPGSTTVKGYPDYFNNFSLGSACNATFNTYTHFHITPHASISTDGDEEDFSTVNYSTWGTSPGPDVFADKQSSLTLNDNPIPGQFESRGDTYGNPPQNDYTYAVPKLNVGDQYCAHTKINPGDGDIGPNGMINATATETPAHDYCVTVTNKPYFKVYNGGISAGGQFSSADGGLCANPAGEGILAGYNNDKTDGYNFGSSAQLTTLAMRAITGVASGMTKYDKSPSRLSFSNTVNVDAAGATSAYDPNLGGFFNTDPSATSCLTTAEADPKLPTKNIGGGTITIDSDPTFAPGARKVQFINASKATITIDASTITRSVSIFTNGKVVIKGNLQYSAGPWTRDTVPSLVIRTKRDPGDTTTNSNIFIDASVKYLDGIYIADRAGGSISTCTTGDGDAAVLMPVSDVNYFTDCANQLVVHGSFVADYINLMRTFGTMRNEKASITHGSGYTPAAGKSKKIDGYNCHGNDSTGLVGNYFYKMSGDSAKIPDYCDKNATVDLGAGIPDNTNGANVGAVPIYRIHTGTAARDWLYTSSLTEAKNNNASSEPPAIAFYAFVTPHANTVPVYRFYDLNQGYHAYSQDSNYLSFVPTSDMAREGVAFYLYTDQDMGGKDEVPAVDDVLNLPTSLQCDNGGGGGGLGASYSLQRLVPGTATGNTCAAEVFDFSPEQYLSHPAIAPPNKGSTVWDSVTSLPPVL
jgi:hypothetical protein